MVLKEKRNLLKMEIVVSLFLLNIVFTCNAICRNDYNSRLFFTCQLKVVN